jgi:hypothetical protein
MKERWKEEELYGFNSKRNNEIYSDLLNRIEEAKQRFEDRDFDTAYRLIGGVVTIMEHLNNHHFDFNELKE